LDGLLDVIFLSMTLRYWLILLHFSTRPTNFTTHSVGTKPNFQGLMWENLVDSVELTIIIVSEVLLITKEC
jgi:hypothetical protein